MANDQPQVPNSPSMFPQQTVPTSDAPDAPKYTREQYAEMERKARLVHDWDSVDYFKSKQEEFGQRSAAQTAYNEEVNQDPLAPRNLLGAAVEPNLTLLTGGAASAAAGLGGLVKGGYNIFDEMAGGSPEPAADLVNRWRSNLTYTPKTSGGQTAIGALGAPGEWWRENVSEKGGRGAEEALTGLGVSPEIAGLAGAGVHTLEESVPQILGGSVLGKGEGFSPRATIADAAGRVSPKLGEKLRREPEDPRVALLRSKGIVPTAGQRASVSTSPLRRQFVGKGEEYIGKHPVFGAHVHAARTRPVVEHIYAQLNESRTAVGLKPLEPGEMNMQDALRDTSNALEDRYDRLLVRTNGDAFMHPLGNGPNFLTDLGQIMEDARGNSPNRRAGDPVPVVQAEGIQTLDNIVVAFENSMSKSTRRPDGSWDVGGKISGPDLRKLNSLLKEQKDAARRGDNFAQQMVPYIEKMQAAFDAMLERSNPGAKPEWDHLRQAYSQYKLVERAATSAGALGREGIPTPRQFLQSVRERALRKGEPGRKLLGRGEAQGQKLATAASDVLGNRVPNSGTPEQLEAWIAASDAIAGAGDAADAAGTGGIAGIGAKIAAGLVGLPAIYSRGFQKYLGDSAARGRTDLPGLAMRGAPAAMDAQQRSKEYMDEQLKRQFADLGILGDEP